MERPPSEQDDLESKGSGKSGKSEEEDSDGMDAHTLLMSKITKQFEMQHRGVDEETAEEFRRIYESAIGSLGSQHRPTHFATAFGNDRLFPSFYGSGQTHSGGGHGQSTPYQPYSPLLTNPLLANSRISPYGSQRHSPPPLPYNRGSPPGFGNSPPTHIRRSSVSSQSRDESASPMVQGQGSWSFEEQFKQLYDIDRDDHKRKEFLDDLFTFMQKHDSPVTRLPIMAKSVLDLYELYKLVVQRGGLVDVINKKLWQEVIKGLNLPSSITSAAFTLRTQYMKFLYKYECHKLSLSSESELQAAIEGNKREGRRTSYPYGDLGGQGGQQPNPHHLHHLLQQQAAVGAGQGSMRPQPQMNGHGPYSRHGSPPTSQSIPNAHGIPPLVMQGAPVSVSQEARILEYIKLINSRGLIATPLNGNGSSPELPESASNNISGIDMTQLAFWNLYNGMVQKPLPFQSTNNNATSDMTPHQSANNNNNNNNNGATSALSEGPLDLGKRKAPSSPDAPPVHIKKEVISTPPPHLPSTDTDDSESEDEHVLDYGSIVNANQHTGGIENCSSQNANSPVVVKIKINGTKYRGVLHPTTNAPTAKLVPPQA